MKIDFLESFDHYLTLPRERAYNEYIDEKNLKSMRVMLTITAAVATIILIVNIAKYQALNLSLVLSVVNIAALLILRIFHSKIFNITNIRRSVIVFLLVQMFVFIAVEYTFPDDPDEKNKTEQSSEQEKEQPLPKNKSGEMNVTFSTNKDETFEDIFFFFSIALLIFKLPRLQLLQLYAAGFCMTLLLSFISGGNLTWNEFLPSTLVSLLFLWIAYGNDRSRQRKFFEHYDFQHRKNFESLRMKRELNYAREIQLSMLPKGDAVIDNVAIAGVSIPATEVGGDYYDYFQISDNEIGLFICDVSGHGVASALMLSALRSSMHLILDDSKNPKEVIDKLNKMIRKTQSRKMFVTAVLALIDTNAEKCRLYNAGHLPPYRISGETGEIFRIRKHGIALGAMQTVDRSDIDNVVTFDFKKGDKVVLYTDGVNEAMNSQRAEFGLDNLEFYLNANSGKSSRELMDGLVNEVKKFCGDADQRDDLTLLIAEKL